MDDGTVITGKFPEADKVNLVDAIREMEQNNSLLCENAVLIAQVKWAYYKGLVDQGFTPDQALELCKIGIAL